MDVSPNSSRRRGPKLTALELSTDERATLERWSRRRRSAQALALQCRIVLACAEGASNTEVAERLGISRPTVTKWRARFVTHRLEGLVDEPRPGAPRTITGEQAERVVVKTWRRPRPTPPTGRPGDGPPDRDVTDQRASDLAGLGLKPHLTETFKLSSDPQFIEKVRDVVGLYLDPPEHAGGAVRGRKAAGASVGPHPADPAAATRGARATHP
jgi:Winged helix-turn helix